MGLGGIFWWTLPNNKAQVIVCDVGQGDAILVTYKNIQMLFDTGPDNKKLMTCLEDHVPFWDKTIEVVILSHGDSDHIGGLNDLLKSYKVAQLFSNEQNIYSQKIGQNEIVSTNMFDFEVVSSGENNGNDDSIVGYLTSKRKEGWSMFMSGDISAEIEQRLVWRKTVDKPVDVLKVSHHGSETATSEEILEILEPKIAVISVGKNNNFGHPREKTLERLKSKNIEIRRTDLEGEIIFSLN